MTSPPSSSDSAQGESPTPSSSFLRLDKSVQHWIWNQGWRTLRKIQEDSIPTILDGEKDLILAAPTASGKTEAAFFPICSDLVHREKGAIRTIYIGPLRALINDQFGRLEPLCESLEIPVHRWHGDVGSAHKRRALERPDGILLITPESLEALLVLRGYQVARFLGESKYVIVDELHAYIGTERGRHLQSLLHRLELLGGHRMRRIGLSATLGDMEAAKEFLRPGGPDQVDVLVSADEKQEVKLQIRGYEVAAVANRGREESETGGQISSDKVAISRHLFSVLRGNHHLVFANSRRAVETYADLLRQMSEEARVPNEFFPHHGSLSRELREDLEVRLRDSTLPTTAICTSTLELGIDIGRVESVAQIGAPPSVAATRQRLGRSGRRGGPAVLRIYMSEPEPNAARSVLDEMRWELVEAIAITDLLIERWYEPPDPEALHLSTLVHQILSLVAERGGITARDAWGLLCGDGPFRSINQSVFADVLRCMGQKDLIVQESGGTILHGGKGERIVNHFTFYAVFETPEEYRLIHHGHVLGTMAIDMGLVEGLHLIFAGRRWKVVSIDAAGKAVHVEAATGGRLPFFEGARGALVHDRVRLEMRRIYESADVPAYLDATATRLLRQGREQYVRLGLERRPIVDDGDGALVFVCRGDRIVNTLAVQLAGSGSSAVIAGPAIQISGARSEEIATRMRMLREHGPVGAIDLASQVRNKARAKFDWVLSDDLLCAEYASRDLDVVGAFQYVKEWFSENLMDCTD